MAEDIRRERARAYWLRRHPHPDEASVGPRRGLWPWQEPGDQRCIEVFRRPTLALLPGDDGRPGWNPEIFAAPHLIVERRLRRMGESNDRELNAEKPAA